MTIFSTFYFIFRRYIIILYYYNTYNVHALYIVDVATAAAGKIGLFNYRPYRLPRVYIIIYITLPHPPSRKAQRTHWCAWRAFARISGTGTPDNIHDIVCSVSYLMGKGGGIKVSPYGRIFFSYYDFKFKFLTD